LNIEVTSKPTEIDELERKVIQLQMERLSIARDEAGSPRLSSLDSSIATFNRQVSELKEKWDLERAGHSLTHLLTHSLTHLLTHSLTHLLTRSFRCK
jgi:ATP-dependent Clp protease ATP-binding subunit ClpB